MSEEKAFSDLMVDIETLGTRAKSAILSIGLLEFDPVSGKFGREQEIVFSPQGVQDQIDAGADVTFDTMKWWITECPGMLPQMVAPRDDHWSWGAGMAQASIAFKGRTRIWAQGPHFDIAMLNASWRLLGAEGEMVEDHWKVRDCRTFSEASGRFPRRVKGQHHNALQDCRSQANAVIQGWSRLGKGDIINVA